MNSRRSLRQKVVRLIYIDEAGIDEPAPVLVLAGVIVKDDQWRSIEEEIDRLIFNQVPESLREGWEFHGHELFFGNSQLSKAGLTKVPRWKLLKDILKVVLKYHLPVICSVTTKNEMTGVFGEYKQSELVSIGFWACCGIANRWLAAYAPTDVGMLIADNAEGQAGRIKAHRAYRKHSAMPMRNLVDTVHFADSRDTWGLQLADCCAYVIKRHETGKTDVRPFYDLIADEIYDRWKFP